MEKQLHKSVIEYFSQLEKLDDKWKELSGIADHLLNCLKNQSEQLCYVTSNTVDNAEICRLVNLRERLTYKINIGIENEIADLLDVIIQLNNANQELKNRLINLENVRNKILLRDPKMKELIDGSPYRPRLDLLMEWTIDGYKYYHELYCNIKNCMKALNCGNVNTINHLSSSFIQNKHKRAHIERILAFTQFLGKENSL